jgi:hypothetical protein
VKIEDLEAKITKRANAVVNEKLKVFRKEIEAALTRLFGQTCGGVDQFGYFSYAEGNKRYPLENMKLQALRMAILDHVKINDTNHTGQPTKLPWPKILWDQEREAIRNELLAKMDLMQQLLMTPVVSEADYVPEGDSIE